jgi:RimJ/RimL family protein N-acetyltransferase
MPIASDELLVHPMELDDTHRFALWPSYPFPYEPFNLDDGKLSATEREEAFRKRRADPDRLTFAVDYGTEKSIAFLALTRIDWEEHIVGNMGYRVHPDWCNRGLGATILRAVSEWCFAHGFRALRLDVAASNARAIRCYEKCGFFMTGEFFQDPKLGNVDISSPEYDFLRPHLVMRDGQLMLRFLWMELSCAQ